jgi:hypothetical protein
MTKQVKQRPVAFDSFLDVRYGLFAGFALGNAAGKAGALGYPVAVLPMPHDDLSQCRLLPRTFCLELSPQPDGGNGVMSLAGLLRDTVMGGYGPS